MSTDDREVLLVRGGTPEAARIAALLDDPAVRASLAARFAELARAVDEVIDEVIEAMRPAVERALAGMVQLTEHLREAGMLPEQPPADPRARALWARRHRSTGPRRPGPEQQHRPRRTR